MKTCFIIMPFSKAITGDSELTKQDLDYIYSDMIKKAVDEYLVDDKRYFTEVLRYEEKVGSISRGIIQKLKEADLVIADLTGLNPNVMYELGVRHSLKRGTIMLTQNFNEFPSDLRDYMTVTYEYSSDNVIAQKVNFESFKIDIHKSILQILETEKSDSPVLEYVDSKEYYRNEGEIERLKENTVIFDAIYEDYNELVSMVSENGESMNVQSVTDQVRKELIVLFLSNIHSKFTQLKIPIVSSIMYHDLKSAKNLLLGLSNLFTMNDSLSENQIMKSLLGQLEMSPAYNLIDLLDKKIIDPFKLKWESKLEYISIRDVFKEEGGILEEDVLEDLEEFLNKEAKRLGVEEEIEILLRR